MRAGGEPPLLVATSVARNFAVIGWTDHLLRLGEGAIRVAHGVLGVAGDEPGELDRAREFVQRQTSLHPAGSPAYGTALTAVTNLDDLIARRPLQVQVLVPTLDELELALRLQEPAEREWRQELGMKARRLDSGEAVSIAIAVARGMDLGGDDRDARVAYQALGGGRCLWTLDLVCAAVRRGLLSEAEARAGYERLRREYGFHAPEWPGLT
jgi:predicted nucleic acid-binding protein